MRKIDMRFCITGNRIKNSIFDMQGKQYVFELGDPPPIENYIEFPRMKYSGDRLDKNMKYTILVERGYDNFFTTFYEIFEAPGMLFTSSDFKFTDEQMDVYDHSVCTNIILIRDKMEEYKRERECSFQRNFDQKVLDYFKAVKYGINLSCGCYGEVTTFSW